MADRRRQQKPKLTEDQGMPGAFEGETVTRRRAVTSSAHIFGGIAAAAFTLPALGFAMGPVFEKAEVGWEQVGAAGSFPMDTYLPKVITVSDGVGEIGRTTVYMRARNPQLDTEPEDEFNQFVALSHRCMHLGCPIRYVDASSRFICPCHGGVYGFRGEVTGGPPVRPLDRFYTRVRAGQVEVGPRYSVNSEFQRYSPRDPAQPLDGIGPYLYPSRPTIRKFPNT